MTNEEMQTRINAIQEKLGTDNFALINDDLGIILTDNQTTNDNMIKQNQQIEKLKKEKENLVNVNSNLFQQVGQVMEDSKQNKVEEDETKPFNFNDAFDEKGNFIN